MKGQSEFLRPQAIKSCKRERTTVRRTCSSKVACSGSAAWAGELGLVTHHRIGQYLPGRSSRCTGPQSSAPWRQRYTRATSRIPTNSSTSQ